MWALFLTKYWKYILVSTLMLFQLASLSTCNHEHKLYVNEKSVHQQDVLNFKNAQLSANKAADAERIRLLKESKTNADEADIRYANLFTQYRDSLLRYKANQSGGLKPDHNQLPPTESSDGPSSNSVISITLDDAQICAVNTARLQAVHDWAVKDINQ